MLKMDLKLLAPKNDIRALKVQVVASFCNIKLNIPPFVIGKDDKSKEFLSYSPLGRLPVLLTANGALLESNTICKYLCSLRREYNLLGKGLFEEAQVNMWIEFNTYELEIPICCYVSGKSTEKSLTHIEKSFDCLNKHLLLNQFMVGNGITCSDLCISVVINFALESNKLDHQIVKKYKHLYRLYETISNQKQYKYIFAPFSNNSINDLHVKGKKKGKEATVGVKEANDGVKEANNKKPQKKIDNNNNYINNNNDDIDVNEKKTKKINPLDLLPISSFSLDEWKYKFSNEPELLKVAMPHFWKVFDKDGWSLYYMKYDKLEDECKISFVTSNMASGFLQRLDNNFSKYSFAVVSVLGENSTFDIEGVWLFRGLEIPFEMKDHPSFEYHIFRKLNIGINEDKQLVESYWCSKDMIDGRPVVDRKVWK